MTLMMFYLGMFFLVVGVGSFLMKHGKFLPNIATVATGLFVLWHTLV